MSISGVRQITYSLVPANQTGMGPTHWHIMAHYWLTDDHPYRQFGECRDSLLDERLPSSIAHERIRQYRAGER